MDSLSRIAVKDSLKFDILQELLSGTIRMAMRHDSSPFHDYTEAIRSDTSRVKIFGKYNIAESPDGTTVAVRPVAPDCSLTIKMFVPRGRNGKKFFIQNGSTKDIMEERELLPGDWTIDLMPLENGYAMDVNREQLAPLPRDVLADEVEDLKERTESDIAVVKQYVGSDACAAEELLMSALTSIEQAEEMISRLITERQDKMRKIEEAVRSERLQQA